MPPLSTELAILIPAEEVTCKAAAVFCPPVTVAAAAPVKDGNGVGEMDADAKGFGVVVIVNEDGVIIGQPLPSVCMLRTSFCGSKSLAKSSSISSIVMAPTPVPRDSMTAQLWSSTPDVP